MSILSVLLLIISNSIHIATAIVSTKTECGTQTGTTAQWCYNVDIYPQPAIQVTDNVTIANPADGMQHSYFHINIKPNDNDCIGPMIDFEFEEIDFAQNNEYLNILRNDSTQITQCTGTQDNNCGNWISCLTDYGLEDVTQINKDDTYTITIYEPINVDDVCGLYSIHARLTIKCAALPSNPASVSPTNIPTQTPTEVTAVPTANTQSPTGVTIPPTSDTGAPTEVTISPTADTTASILSPTSIPTQIPTAVTISPTADTLSPTEVTAVPTTDIQSATGATHNTLDNIYGDEHVDGTVTTSNNDNTKTETDKPLFHEYEIIMILGIIFVALICIIIGIMGIYCRAQKKKDTNKRQISVQNSIYNNNYSNNEVIQNEMTNAKIPFKAPHFQHLPTGSSNAESIYEYNDNELISDHHNIINVQTPGNMRMNTGEEGKVDDDDDDDEVDPELNKYISHKSDYELDIENIGDDEFIVDGGDDNVQTKGECVDMEHDEVILDADDNVQTKGEKEMS